ncbi:MAG TPA: hypothetical protein VKR32_04050 [Puia sp.]|nr:hypothetical protein [Puia sp.]
MKKMILACFAGMAILSCRKNSSSSAPPPTDKLYYASSARILSPLTQIIDSVIYDSSHHLARLWQMAYDTTSGTASADSIEIVFNPGGNGVPDSYTFSDFGSGDTGDVHHLAYDGQNRIIGDSSLSGSGFVNHFTYPPNAIASTLLFDASGTDNQIDTLVITNGNISSETVYYPNNTGTGDTLSGQVYFGYSPYPNPLYNPAVAATIGPLVYLLLYDGFGGYYDVISKNVINKITGVAAGLPSGGATYTIVPDSQGRVGKILTHFGPGENGSVIFYYYP